VIVQAVPVQSFVRAHRPRWRARRFEEGAFLGIPEDSPDHLCWEVRDSDGELSATAALRRGDQLLLSAASPEAVQSLADVLRGHDVPGWFAPAPASALLRDALGERRFRVAKRVLHHRLAGSDAAAATVPAVPGLVRRAGPADVEATAALLALLQREVLTLRPVDPVATVTAHIDEGALWVLDQGEVVAMASLGSGPEPYLDHVVVAPAHRRHGLARGLVAQLCGPVVASGGMVRLSTHRDNLRANHLFAQLGFRVMCEMENVRRVDPSR